MNKVNSAQKGGKIRIDDNRLFLPENPVIPYIEGDGIGPEVMSVARKVLDAGVKKAYQGSKKIIWLEIYAGEKAKKKYGEYLPPDTIQSIREYIVAIKGPLTTPVGGRIPQPECHLKAGFRALCLCETYGIFSWSSQPGAASRKDEYGYFQGEHGRCLCRHRMAPG